jgi:lysophospholipase L1-like esterase
MYVSYFKPQDNTHYHVWTPNAHHYLTKPEFNFWRPTNSLGFADDEWSVNKSPNQTRILALGDSFTEGDGAEYDSSYVSILKNRLLKTDTNYYVMNGGICGSDPFNNFIILKDLLLKYQPDIVIQVLASHDLTSDIIHRGGFERFKEDGTQEFKKAPWWEPIYAISYLSRLFFDFMGYDEVLTKKSLDKTTILELNNTLINLFETYSQFCEENGIKLFLFLRPDKGEIEIEKYSFNFNIFEEYVLTNKNIIYHDLLPCYLNTINKSNSKTENYFWKYDGHHNAQGYKMMADCVFDKIN